MWWVRLWNPRDTRSAASTMSVLLLVTGVALLVDYSSRFLLLRQWDPWPPTTMLAHMVLGGIVVPAAVFALARGARRRRDRPSIWLGALGPLVALIVITAFNLESRDASAGSQFFVMFPLVYAAHHLRRVASAVVCAATVACQTVLCFVALPHYAATRASVVMGMVVIAITWLVSTLHDRREEALTALHQRASIDTLTGLATRQVLEARADEVMAHPVSGSEVALLLVDLDHFKTVNDTYGHPTGDAVLAAVAPRLQHAVRSEDLVARMGGDELAVLLTRCDQAQARRRGEELLAAVCWEPVEAGPHRIHLSVSIGIATGQPTFSTLYSAADADLYQAKRGGRGRVSGAQRPHEVTGAAKAADVVTGVQL